MSEDVDSIADYPFEACANCGKELVPDNRYPVRTTEDEDGNVQIYSFCDEGCLSAWGE